MTFLILYLFWISFKERGGSYDLNEQLGRINSTKFTALIVCGIAIWAAFLNDPTETILGTTDLSLFLGMFAFWVIFGGYILLIAPIAWINRMIK